MEKEVNDLIKLQAEIKMKFMKRGLPEIVAHEIAGDALHLFTESDAINKAHKEAYDNSQPAP